jgi:hypothetical protein
MSTFTIKIEGLQEMVRQLKNYPNIARSQYAKAINTSLGLIAREANDSNFLFRTPRALRSGLLERSFQKPDKLASPNDLTGKIGPKVWYAPLVYFGTNRTRANPYMDRIAMAAEPAVQRQFKTALDFVVEALAKGGI